MPSDRVLSQDEIDNLFRNLRDSGDEDLTRKAEPYDFRRPDRIAKDQLRAIHLIHENFARTLASNLSAYLRAYVTVNLVSVEQISFREFLGGLPSPTCLVSLGMKPFESGAAIELGPGLVFPVLEMLLGGNARLRSTLTREITEIEQSVLEGFLRLILQNLRSAWQNVCQMDFSPDGYETEPALLQILAPNESLLAISMEVKIGENSGIMNLAIPSIIVKMLRQKFDQQWSVRRTEVKEEEHARMWSLIRPAKLQGDVRLQGPTLPLSSLMDMQAGDVLRLDYSVSRPIDLLLNGKLKYRGRLLAHENRKALSITEPAPAPE